MVIRDRSAKSEFRRRITLLVLWACLCFGVITPVAAEEALWEVGAGLGALTFPDYLGSDQRHAYLVPLPYLIYRGTFLKVERDKVRGLLYQDEHSEWDISLGAAVPVKSNDNAARAGMANLDPTFEIGPQWSYKIRDDSLKVTLRLPVRKVLSVDFPRVHDVGWIFAPTLALDRDNHPWPGWQASISTGPLFGDRNYHAYYYSVGADATNASRQAYTATGGYGGWQFTTTLGKRYRRVWIGGFLRINQLNGAVFIDSPLVRQTTSWMAGIGVSVPFMESSTRVGSVQ